MNNEKKLFEQALSAASGDWDIRLEPHMEPGSFELSKYISRLYVVDTSTGWIGAGAIEPKEFDAAIKWAKKNGLTQDDCAQRLSIKTLELGEKKLVAGDASIADCLQLMAATMAKSKSFELAKSKSLDAHFLYVTYRMKDGSAICRPFIFSTQTQGFCPSVELQEALRYVISLDLGSSSTEVGRLIKKSGGPILCDDFRQ